jgi:hypothetical protein
MASNEASSGPTVEPEIWPMSSDGKNPLGIAWNRMAVRTKVPNVIVVLFVMVDRLQESRTQHRRQGQRHDARDQDGEGDDQAELVEHAADNAAHEQHRNEHGDQRQRHRDDGETDFLGALEGGLHRLLARLDVAHDVLEHDDGVVDHEAHGERQRQQGDVVDRMAADIHAGKSADDRDRQRDGRDQRRPEAAQEEVDGDDNQHAGQHQGELNVVDGMTDGNRTVGEDGDLNAGRQLCLNRREHRFDPVDDLHGVGVGLPVDGEHDGAGAVQPACDLVVLDTVDRRRDVGDPHRCAVLPSDDHRHVVGRLVDGAGGVEDRALALVGDGADRLARVGVDDGRLQFLQCQPAHRELVEVGANANSVFLRAEDQHLGDARQGRDARQDGAVGEGIDVGQAHLRRLQRQEHHGIVRRVDLAEAGRRRQFGRQAAHCRGDRRLHVERGAVN